MKVGDLVKYTHDETMGVVIACFPQGGTLLMVTIKGLKRWCVISYCEVIDESR